MTSDTDELSPSNTRVAVFSGVSNFSSLGIRALPYIIIVLPSSLLEISHHPVRAGLLPTQVSFWAFRLRAGSKN